MRFKSKIAFVMNVQNLFDHFPRDMYFWTFTWKAVYPDWWYPDIFNSFSRKVQHLYPAACGMRVVEAHELHGLHYHLVVNKRMSIQLIRRIAEKYGIGRISVCKCYSDGISWYLAKYLTEDNNRLFGPRRWSTWGAYKGIRKNDIVVESRYMGARRKLLKAERIPIGWEQLLQRVYALHGFRGLSICIRLLRKGKTGTACKLVSPNIYITERGGLANVPLNRVYNSIPYRIVKSHS